MSKLPLAAAWLSGSRDRVRDAMLATLEDDLAVYCAEAQGADDEPRLSAPLRRRNSFGPIV